MKGGPVACCCSGGPWCECEPADTVGHQQQQQQQAARLEQERRLQLLFQQLDVNQDGGLCVNDLAAGLQRLGVYRTESELR
eukprot:g37893.t1